MATDSKRKVEKKPASAQARSGFDALLPKSDSLGFLRGGSVHAAVSMLGKKLVAVVDGERREVTVTKVRAFEGLGKFKANEDGLTLPAGHIYLMRFRSASFLNITTGLRGEPSCVWIEEGVTPEGQKLSKTGITNHLGVGPEHNLAPIAGVLSILAGPAPAHVQKVDEEVSENTVGVFKAEFEPIGGLADAIKEFK